jgi:NADPH2:quinone reductase
VKAIRQHVFGGPEQLRVEEVPDPEPAAHEVRIAVEAAGVHVVDTTIRQGASFGALPPPALPMTPGREVAGSIESAGPAVDPAWLGRRVVVHLGPASGGYASLAVADLDDVLVVPDHVDAAGAVAMVGTGRTTLGILEVAGVRSDDVVVVTAAAGGIGGLLVQAARSAGATVVGVAGGPRKVEAVERLGADVVVDYRADGDWPARVRDGLDGRPVSLALDGVGGAAGRAAFELVTPGGRMVVFGFASGEPMPLSVADLFARGVTVIPGIGARLLDRPGGLRPLAAAALDELAAGRLVPLVHPPFPLARVADAHRAIESRATIGKVVLVP